MVPLTYARIATSRYWCHGTAYILPTVKPIGTVKLPTYCSINVYLGSVGDDILHDQYIRVKPVRAY